MQGCDMLRFILPLAVRVPLNPGNAEPKGFSFINYANSHPGEHRRTD